MNILELIEQRQSSRVPFDPDRRIPEDHLRQILEGARSAPTAHNMQNFEVVVDDDRRLLKRHRIEIAVNSKGCCEGGT